MRILSSSNERSRWIIGVAIVVLAGLPPLVALALGRFGVRRFGFPRGVGALAGALTVALLTSEVAIELSTYWLPATAVAGALGCASGLWGEGQRAAFCQGTRDLYQFQEEPWQPLVEAFPLRRR